MKLANKDCGTTHTISPCVNHVQKRSIDTVSMKFKGCRPCRRPRKKGERGKGTSNISHIYIYIDCRSGKNHLAPSDPQPFKDEDCFPYVQPNQFYSARDELCLPFACSFRCLHGKMPNVTSETVEKTIVLSSEVLLLLLAVTATLVDHTSNERTCRQQNTTPLKDEPALELRRKMPNVTSETVEYYNIIEKLTKTLVAFYSWLLHYSYL